MQCNKIHARLAIVELPTGLLFLQERRREKERNAADATDNVIWLAIDVGEAVIGAGEPEAGKRRSKWQVARLLWRGDSAWPPRHRPATPPPFGLALWGKTQRGGSTKQAAFPWLPERIERGHWAG